MQLSSSWRLPQASQTPPSKLYELTYKECLRRAARGRPTKQAPRMFVENLAAMEVFVMDRTKPKYLRIFG